MDTLKERIRRRAYEIWEREGRSGRPEDHWYRAESEIAEGPVQGSDATVEAAQPAAAVEAVEEVGSDPARESAKKPRRKRAP